MSICGNCYFILTLLGVCHETVNFFPFKYKNTQRGYKSKISSHNRKRMNNKQLEIQLTSSFQPPSVVYTRNWLLLAESAGDTGHIICGTACSPHHLTTREQSVPGYDTDGWCELNISIGVFKNIVYVKYITLVDQNNWMNHRNEYVTSGWLRKSTGCAYQPIADRETKPDGTSSSFVTGTESHVTRKQNGASWLLKIVTSCTTILLTTITLHGIIIVCK